MSGSLGSGEVALRLAATVLAALLLGLDRGGHAQPAGLRTTVLVALAAAAATVLANLVFLHTADTHNEMVRLDPMRLPLGVLSGIGFIGGGAILRRGDMVLGVTTAATLWLATVVGLCFGAGWFALGAGVTALALAVLWPLHRLGDWLRLTARRGSLLAELAADGPDPQSILDLLSSHGFALHARTISLQMPAQMRSLECSGRYRADYPGWSQRLVAELAHRPGVLRVEWRDMD